MNLEVVGSGASGFTVAVLRDGSVDVETHALPDRVAGELDVGVTLAAICGSDLHTVSGRRHAPDGTALGHEAVGRVVAADPGTLDARGTPLTVGDRVVFGMIAACGDCDRCRGGLTMKCRSLFKYGHATLDEPPHATGMLADVVRLRPEVTVLRAPDHVADAALVSVACAAPTAAAGVRALGPDLPDEATVIGAGAVGLYLVAMLATAGVKVQVVEPRVDRCEVAADLGGIPVSHVPEGTPAVLDASGAGAAVSNAVAVAGVGARLVLLGSVSPGRDTVGLDPATVVLRRLTIVGIHNYAEQDLFAAVDWLGDHGEQAPNLIGEPVPLDEVKVAFDGAFAGRTPRIAVVP